jgi:hypothetical protein
MSPYRRHSTRAVILSLVGALALAGCGDDDDEPASEGSPATSGGATTASDGGTTATTATSGGPTTASAGGPATTASSADSTAPTTGSTSSGTRVELIDAGPQGQRVRLPGTAEVGQSAATEMTSELQLAMEGPGVSEEVPFSFRMGSEAQIVEVTESGYVAETTITTAELDEGPPGFDPASFGQLAGVTYRQETSADGTTGDAELVNAGQVTDAQRQAFNQFVAQLQSTSLAYPSEPVGPGARWRATQPITNQGLSFEITYEYELTSIEGDSYQIDIAYDQDVDEDVEQGGQTGRMRGTISGGGQSSGSLTNPLAVNTSMQQDFDVDIESGGQEVAMTMDVRVDIESTAG